MSVIIPEPGANLTSGKDFVEIVVVRDALQGRPPQDLGLQNFSTANAQVAAQISSGQLTTQSVLGSVATVNSVLAQNIYVTGLTSIVAPTYTQLATPLAYLGPASAVAANQVYFNPSNNAVRLTTAGAFAQWLVNVPASSTRAIGIVLDGSLSVSISVNGVVVVDLAQGKVPMPLVTPPFVFGGGPLQVVITNVSGTGYVYPHPVIF